MLHLLPAEILLLLLEWTPRRSVLSMRLLCRNLDSVICAQVLFRNIAMSSYKNVTETLVILTSCTQRLAISCKSTSILIRSGISDSAKYSHALVTKVGRIVDILKPSVLALPSDLIMQLIAQIRSDFVVVQCLRFTQHTSLINALSALADSGAQVIINTDLYENIPNMVSRLHARLEARGVPFRLAWSTADPSHWDWVEHLVQRGPFPATSYTFRCTSCDPTTAELMRYLRR